MILVKESDILHKFHLQQLLIAVVDDQYLSQFICFKGGTCAEMSGFLDRFSVDLDFDIVRKVDEKKFRSRIKMITKRLDLIDDNKQSLASKAGKNKESLFFNFKYKAPQNQRNKLKFSFFQNIVASNVYEPRFLPEINRTVTCQTIGTMFANKLVTPIDRYERHKEIEGRDIYDIYHFFQQGYELNEAVVKERTKLELNEYVKKLVKFIDENVTDKMIAEDLNMLLPLPKFTKIRKTLKQDTLLYLRNLI